MIAPLDLPPLPEPGARANIAGHGEVRVGWTADQMHAYARQAVLAERERCAGICEMEKVDADASGSPEDHAYNMAITHCVAAIRGTNTD